MSEADGSTSASRKENTSNRMHRYSSSASETSETSKTSETSETSEISETSKTPETSETSDEGEETESRLQWVGDTSVRDRENLNFYLPEELKTEIHSMYRELNIEYQQRYDEKLEKHTQYYPHLVMVGLDKDRLREQLGLT